MCTQLKDIFKVQESSLGLKDETIRNQSEIIKKLKKAQMTQIDKKAEQEKWRTKVYL